MPYVYVQCVLPLSVSSLALTPTKLVLGTYEGFIHLFCWHQLRSNSSTALDTQQSETLLAHYKCVYSLACMSRGSISHEGLTSLCPTFVGRCTDSVAREFLISVGYGKHSVLVPNKTSNSLFRSLTMQTGVCLHVWII